MPRYVMEVTEVVKNTYRYEIDASNEEEAEDMIDESPDKYLTFEYSKTIDGDSDIYEKK